MKECRTCRETKEETSFSKNRASADGLSVSCKVCGKKYRMERNKRLGIKPRALKEPPTPFAVQHGIVVIFD